MVQSVDVRSFESEDGYKEVGVFVDDNTNTIGFRTLFAER